MADGEQMGSAAARGSTAGAPVGEAARDDFETLMMYVFEHEAELRQLGCDSIQACLLTGRATKTRPGNEERAKHYWAFMRMKESFSVEQMRRLEVAQERICRGAVQEREQFKEEVKRSIVFLDQNQEKLIARRILQIRHRAIKIRSGIFSQFHATCGGEREAARESEG